MHFILIIKLVQYTTPCSCLIMHVNIHFIKTTAFMCNSLIRKWLLCSFLWDTSLHGFADSHTIVSQHLHHSMKQRATMKCNEKIGKYSYYAMLTLSTVKFVAAIFLQQNTRFTFSKLASSWRSEKRKTLGGTSKTYTATVVSLQLCAFNVTPLQWHRGRGKIFQSSRSRGVTSASQWPSTLSPDWSQLTFIPKVTPDDSPGGFSAQLMIEYSLYSRSWLYGYGRTLHCQSLYSRQCEERMNHSVQLLSTAFNIIWLKYKETPMWFSYNLGRLKDY